jgi:hypothetical protein
MRATTRRVRSGWDGVVTVLVAGAITACGREGGGVLTPCPIAPMFAIPWADTIAVGDTVRFRIPASDLVHTPARLIRWASSNEAVATVTPDSDLAHALAVGLAEIDAMDMNSPSNCRTSWFGTLRVQVIKP